MEGLISDLEAVEEVASTEFVPPEGEEEGGCSFLGSICFQKFLGNLDPSDRTTKARRVKNSKWCLQKPGMMTTDIIITTHYSGTAQNLHLALNREALEGFLQQTCSVMYGSCQLVWLG